MFNRRLLIANSGDIPAVVTINFYLKCLALIISRVL